MDENIVKLIAFCLFHKINNTLYSAEYLLTFRYSRRTGPSETSLLLSRLQGVVYFVLLFIYVFAEGNVNPGSPEYDALMLLAA